MGYKAHSNRTTQIAREETWFCHIGYFFQLTARVILYAPFHKQDRTYSSLCYTSHGALAGTRNSSMGSPHEGSIQRSIAPWANALTTELHLATLAGTRNSSVGPPWRIDLTTHRTMSERSYHGATSCYSGRYEK